MRQDFIKTKYIDLNFKSCDKLSQKIKNSIKKANSPEILIDLSAMNILDATKIMVLSSAYHYQKFPQGKIKCKLSDSQRCNFINPFITNNLELV